jgi:peptidoglycan/xylan/chitin deacetylase (PgdA/CDA1 family)
MKDKNTAKTTVITYHYVRDLKHSKYPEIKGLDLSLFYQQVIYLKKHYEFITVEMLIDALENNTKLPDKSVLLTFDDGYIDHFDCVFPFLDKHKIQGAFYPPAKAITEHTVLDVNKIHFILASEPDKAKIISEIKNALVYYKSDYDLKSYSFYHDKLAKPSRYDPADIVFIKRLLQVELEESVRKIITNDLFERIVGIDEKSFSKSLYMSLEQISCMNRNGMHIGSHGFDHYWLGSLSREKQNVEIEKSMTFLKLIGADETKLTMCYPYGNYNETTLDLLAEHEFKLAFTTGNDITHLEKKNRFTLNRLDTTAMPVDQFSDPNEWYYKV